MTAQEKIDKLKELGLWYKWRKNIFQSQIFVANKKRFAIKILNNEDEDFRGFICCSFPWDFTPEGNEFWYEISLK